MFVQIAFFLTVFANVISSVNKSELARNVTFSEILLNPSLYFLPLPFLI
jgi:hypothetical protein